MIATLAFNDLRVQYISRIGAVYYLALLCCGGLPVLGLKSKNNTLVCLSLKSKILSDGAFLFLTMTNCTV